MLSSHEPASRRELMIEAATFAACFALLVYLLRSALILGETTLTHDNIYWNYPIYHYFARSLDSGAFPLWNPHTHAGEPFYVLLAHFRFFEPIPYLTLFVGRLFTSDTLILFQWERILESTFALYGTYLLVRCFARHVVARISALPILFLSSFMLASFRQDGVINQFMWAPFAVYFLHKISLGDARWGTWSLFGISVGINFQSYFFTGIAIFLLFYVASLASLRWSWFVGVLRAPGALKRIAGVLALIVGLMALNLQLASMQSEFVYVARMIGVEPPGPNGHERVRFEGGPENLRETVRLSYDDVLRSGVFSPIDEYIDVIDPRGMFRWYRGFTFLGLLPWLVVLIGITAGRHPLRSVWLLTTWLFTFYAIGRGSLLHEALFYVYPPTNFVRNTESLGLFVFMGAMVFFALGMERVIERMWLAREPAPSAAPLLARWISALRKLLLSIALAMPVGLIAFYDLANKHQLGHVVLTPLVLAGYGFLLHKRGLLALTWPGLWLVHVGMVLMAADEYVFYAVIVLVPSLVPLALGLMPSASLRRRRGALLALLALNVLTLIMYVQSGRYLYAGNVHVAKSLGVDTSLRAPTLLERRKLAPTGAFPLDTGQPMRYLGILRDETAVFSELDYLSWNPAKAVTSFEDAYRAKRWNSMLFTTGFFQVLHSPIAPSLKTEIFAVGAPVFQLKRGAIELGTTKPADVLGLLPEQDALLLLRDYTLVEGGKVSPEALERAVRAALQAARGRSQAQALDYRVRSYSPNRIELSLKSREQGVVYWADGYDKRWSAQVDGRHVALRRANYHFKAFELPAGAHRVVLEYRPRSFFAAASVFYGTIAIGLLTASISFQRARRAPAAA